MVRPRVNSAVNRCVDEHILIIGNLPFTPQEDGTSGKDSWKPVKDLVRYCMAQSCGDDPNVKIQDYRDAKFQPQAYVKLKKEENAKCVFESIAGNFWYGIVLQVWWMISPTQVCKERPAKLLQYKDSRDHPEALERHTQIRDEKLLRRGSFPTGIHSSPTSQSTRGRRNTFGRNTRNTRQARGASIGQYGTPTNYAWPSSPNNGFPYRPPMNTTFYSEPYRVPPEANQWPMALPSNPPLMTGNENMLPIQQWMPIMSPVSGYEVPVPMNMPVTMSLPMGMTPVYPTAPSYMVAPIMVTDGYMPGYTGYIPPSDAEYSYPNQNFARSMKFSQPSSLASNASDGGLQPIKSEENRANVTEECVEGNDVSKGMMDGTVIQTTG